MREIMGFEDVKISATKPATRPATEPRIRPAMGPKIRPAMGLKTGPELELEVIEEFSMGLAIVYTSIKELLPSRIDICHNYQY